MSSICECISKVFCFSRPNEHAVHSVSFDSVSINTAKKISMTMSPILIQLEKDSNSCSICLEDFELTDRSSFTSCEHTFHTECFDKWAAHLLKSNQDLNCPNCRNMEVSIIITT
ncbi:MAG: hypothetical protein ACI8RA_001554 [Chlamydiales bacterium]|jgi:hypothetical protein